MLEINWKQDYKNEFICPLCEQSQLGLGGFNQGKRQFQRPSCKSRLLASMKLSSRSRYLDSRLKDEHIDWEKDYHGEFVCPECGKPGMCAWGIKQPNNKRQFRCLSCKKTQQDSFTIDKIEVVQDPFIKGLKWYTNHKIKGFICPECNDENIYLAQIDKFDKKIFKCRTCRKHVYDSIILSKGNLTYYSDNSLPVKSFNWKDEQWDLRAINPKFDERDNSYYIANFTEFELNWFKDEVKKYIQHLCKAENSLGTIALSLSSLRFFSRYLVKENISGFDEINRSLSLDYFTQEKKLPKAKLGALRNFFAVGTIKGWFNIDQDIIRDVDYPKQYRGNPDPISDRIREQIEQNLYLLPDPIARMWLIGYFSAMRPSELALLKRDCLVREGQHWKLVWQRKKGKDEHEVPISRTIAEVVQQQQEYIKNLWTDEWDYLFCHYHNLSSTDPSQPKLEAVKKILPTHKSHPLLMGIRSLITALDILMRMGN